MTAKKSTQTPTKSTKPKATKSTKATKPAKPLTPVDLLRCQVELTTTNAWVVGGAVKTTERCKSAARWVLTEKRPGPDGGYGAMSVCDACLAVARRQLGATFHVEAVSKYVTVAPRHLVIEHSVSGRYARAINARVGRPGYATDAEIRAHIEMVITADAEALTQEG